MHHSDEREGLDELVADPEKIAELEKRVSDFQERGSDVEEEKADPGTKAEAEARLRKALSGAKGGAVDGEVGKREPGATGLFPGGKLTPNDKGQIGFKIGHTKDKRKVILDFGKPTTWIGFTRDEAFSFSRAVRKHAKKCKP